MIIAFDGYFDTKAHRKSMKLGWVVVSHFGAGYTVRCNVILNLDYVKPIFSCSWLLVFWDGSIFSAFGFSWRFILKHK